LQAEFLPDEGAAMNLKQYVRTIPDFPEKGVMFRDVTTLFNNSAAFEATVEQLYEQWAGDASASIAGIDARGFIIGGALAYRMKLPFVVLRKQGKLPFDTLSEDYDLEYGKATLEIHKDAIKPGDRVLIVDDLIATGGTAAAGVNLVRALGAEVAGCAFIIDLPMLGGADKLREMGVKVQSLMTFDGH
jgi:adenine phosphoribosyltransferase